MTRLLATGWHNAFVSGVAFSVYACIMHVSTLTFKSFDSIIVLSCIAIFKKKMQKKETSNKLKKKIDEFYQAIITVIRFPGNELRFLNLLFIDY